MTKNIKRAGACILAAAMLAGSAFATGLTASATGGNYSYSLTGITATSYTISAYLVAQPDNSSTEGYTYESWVSNATNVSVDTLLTYSTSSSYGSEIVQYAESLAAYVGNGTVSATTTATNSSSLTGLDAGYYLILVQSTDTADTIYQPILVQISADGGSSNIKSASVDITKELIDNVTVTSGTTTTSDLTTPASDIVAADGVTTITYRIDTTIPYYSVDSTNNVTFKITDTTSNTALSVSGYEVYTVDAATDVMTELDTLYWSESGGVITFTDAYLTADSDNNKIADNGGTKIVVIATATLSSDAVVNQAYTNTATLTYSTDYVVTSDSTSTTSDTEDVYTAEITITKTDADTESEQLEATFAVYSEYSGGTLSNQVGTITTIDGTGTLSDLAAGTYYIQETTAPSGYTRDTTVHTVVISGTEGNYSSTGSSTGWSVTDGVYSATIKNTAAGNLPGTGGIGTTLFAIGGIVLIAGAGFMLFVYMKKRNAAE